MLVHERVGICQFEWYRDNIEYITVSNRKVWGVFLYHGQLQNIPPVRLDAPRSIQPDSHIRKTRAYALFASAYVSALCSFESGLLI